MRILNKDVRLQDVSLMYLLMLATLVLILVASYQTASAPPLGPPGAPGAPQPPNPSLAFRMLLDPLGELQLAWNVSYARQELLMELTAARPRYGLVLGMSDRGETTDADLVVLWDNGKQSYFGDAWSDSQGRVTLDSQQDYQLLEARQTPRGFTLLFKRAFMTCDPRDYLIEEGTVHVIYAVLDRPISSLEQLDLSRLPVGLQRVLLLRPNAPPMTLPPNVRSLEVRAPQVTIPAQETTYWCYIHLLPANMPKNHIVMYESVVTPGNEAIVHHMEVFECSPDGGDVPPYSGSCDDTMKPKKLNTCRHVLAAWAMGAEAFYYPPDAGLPLGGPRSSRFLRLEVHYHNPLLLSGRRDSSGVRLFYTPTLRRYDAGIMELGLVYTPIMAIPPRERGFTLTGYCTDKCTKTALPPGGIHIFASQLHTHLAGRGVRTVLLRGGREVEVVQEDKHFSTHYQTIRILRKMVNVLPGDALLTKCTFNTEDRTGPTVGGFGIMEEMCVNYIHYYPRTQLELCKSHVDPGYLQKYFSFINRFQGSEPCVCGQTGVTEQYGGLQWDAFSAEVLSSLYSSSPISMHCNRSIAQLFPGEWERQAVPEVTAQLPRQRYPCEGGPPQPAARSQEPTLVQPNARSQEPTLVQPGPGV